MPPVGLEPATLAPSAQTITQLTKLAGDAKMQLRIHTFVLKCHLVGFKEVKTPPRAITVKTNTTTYATHKANRPRNLGISEAPIATPNANRFDWVDDTRNFPDFWNPENENIYFVTKKAEEKGSGVTSYTPAGGGITTRSHFTDAEIHLINNRNPSKTLNLTQHHWKI